MRNNLVLTAVTAFVFFSAYHCSGAKDSTQVSSHKAVSQSKTPIATVDPFKVDGMTVISPLKNGELYPFASDFVATVRLKMPSSKTIAFKAIDLYNTDLSVSVNGKKVWQPEIKGFKDFVKSNQFPIIPDSTLSDSVTVKLSVYGLQGGLRLFEIYSE